MKVPYLLTRPAPPERVRRIIVAFFFAALSLAVADGIAEVIGEGPAKTGSAEYVAAGADGNGIIIAVIDNNFYKLEESQLSGDAPEWGSIVDTAVFSSGGLTDSGTTHGTNVLQVIYDHAPGAEYCLYKVASGTPDASQLQSAVDAAIMAGADIISMSVLYRNQGWEDSAGGACAAVNKAADSGILVFVASGNSAVQHWRGMFNDPGGDSYHNWLGADRFDDVSLDSAAVIHATLQWDTSTGITNYDLYLFNDAENEILKSSTLDGEAYEDLSYPDSTGADRTVKLAVRKVSGNPTMIQLFVTGQTGISQSIQYYTSGGSIGSPANADEMNVLSVGAVTQSIYDTVKYTDGIIKIYSSRGPTNSGRVEPDFVAPTDCQTSLGTSTGTSGAAPNAAGTAAAFWSSAPNLRTGGISHLLEKQAEIFKDWGEPGVDTVYGHGGICLYKYHVNTVWVDTTRHNYLGWPTDLFYYVSDAQSYATPGGRVVFIAGEYSWTGPPGPLVLNKRLLYESIGGSAVIRK